MDREYIRASFLTLQNVALVLITAGKPIRLCIFTRNDRFLAYVFFVIHCRLPYSFSFWLGYGKRNYSFPFLPCSPLFSATSPRDPLQSQHRVTLSGCDRLAYFWNSVPTLSLLEKNLEKRIHLEEEEEASPGARHSVPGLWLC